MTKEQRDRIAKYEVAMNRALKINFLHLNNGEFGELMDVYNELFTPLNKSQMTCGTCRLNAVKKLAAEYFKSAPEEKEKKKPGRPKKIEKLFEKLIGNGGTDDGEKEEA